MSGIRNLKGFVISKETFGRKIYARPLPRVPLMTMPTVLSTRQSQVPRILAAPRKMHRKPTKKVFSIVGLCPGSSFSIFLNVSHENAVVSCQLPSLTRVEILKVIEGLIA